MADEILRAARDGAVATITLNRPHANNALDRALVESLGAALEAAGGDDAVRAVVLTGEGGAFCAGADLKAAMAENAFADLEGVLDRYHRVIRAITSAPKPVLAAVDGPAVGFGCDLALACDLRVLSTGAYLQEKFVKIGLMPDGGGTFFLPRLVGLGRAMELMLTGEAVGADRARELGLANRVVAPASLMQETMRLARELAGGPPLAFAAIKRAVRIGLTGTLDDALGAERGGQLECLRSRDCTEGITAFFEKRPPAFQGK
jgi:enoyl-CoA hydratase/carnithine racemase